MKASRQYEIAFVGLKTGLHEFAYHIEDEFFSAFGQPEFSEAALDVKLILDKQQSFFLLKFEITGSVKVNCDRCGSPFRLNIWDEFDQVVKLVDNPEDMEADEAPEISYISRTESHLNVAGWIYEFILLSIPMQRIHPDTPDGKSGCDPEVLKILGEMTDHDDQNAVNPIWKDLDQFKEN